MQEISFVTEDTEYAGDKYVGGKVIRKYTESSTINYPNLVLCSDSKVDFFRVQVLRGMLKKPGYLEKKDSYYVYMNIEDQLIEVGLLNTRDLKTVISSKIFEMFEKYVCLDKEIKVSGDLLYALCVSDNVEI